MIFGENFCVPLITEQNLAISPSWKLLVKVHLGRYEISAKLSNLLFFFIRYALVFEINL